jgi:hypothetical protein
METIEKVCSTLFIKKTNHQLRIGSLPGQDWYNTKYILKYGKYISPKDLNDLFVLHILSGKPWDELIRDNIK